MWLWLWCRPAAAAPIQPLAWKLPCAAGVALKRKKKKDPLKPEQQLPRNVTRQALGERRGLGLSMDWG